MRPLRVEDVHIRVLVPSTSSPTPLFSSASSGAHVLPNPTTPQLPTPSAVHLDDIRIHIHLSPAEALFHLPRPLSPSEEASVSGWLSHSVSLCFLRRLSSRLSHALSLAPSASQLEERARLVAEAMGVRAEEAANMDENSGSRPAELRRAMKLLTERASLAEALDQFNEKILAFASTDTETAALLAPTREALRTRLRAATAELAAYGFAPAEAKTRPKHGQEDTRVPQALFVLDAPPDHLSLESESDTDESDLARAERLPDEELQFVLVEPRSESGGYISGDTEGDEHDEASDELDRCTLRTGSHPALGKANFVIDLDRSPAGSRRKIRSDLASDTRGGPPGIWDIELAGRKDGRQELEELGVASPVACRRVTRPEVAGRRALRISDEQEDGSDLECSASKHRGRARDKNRVRSLESGCPEKDLDADDECVLF